MLGFCIASLCDWLKKIAPLSQPIRSKTKTKRDLLHAFSLSSDLFIGLPVSVVIGQCDYFGLI